MTAFSLPGRYKEHINGQRNSSLAAGRPNPDNHPSRALLALIDIKLRGKE